MRKRCIERKYKMVKKLTKLIMIVIISFTLSILSFFSDNSCFSQNAIITQAEEIKDSDLYAKSALLMDADTKRVLYQKNGYEKMPMASTTKIMTCLLALEKSKDDDVVEFSQYAASMPQVKLGANKGRKFYMKDLLYSLMLESHNDTAVAIAEKIGGSTTEFANLMNERAKKIGTKNTNFVTPNGLDDPMHYTTAYDLALIAAEAIKNEKFVQIINTTSHSFTDIDGKCNFCVSNKDAFLTQMQGAFGIKTGFTGNAGYCFVGALKRDNKTFISVVLASGWPPSKTYKWQDTRKLMNYGINNYNYKVVFEGIKNYKDLKVERGQKNSTGTTIDGNLSLLLSNNDVIDFQYDFPKEGKIKAPVKKGQIVGWLNIIVNGDVLKSYKICATKSVKKETYSFDFNTIFSRFLLDFF